MRGEAPRRATPTACAPSTPRPTSAPTRGPQPRRRRPRHQASVAAYAFNEGSGTSAADASGSGLTGTLTNGAAWATGRNAGAVQLDGVNDFVELGNPTLLQLTGSMTVSAWVNSAAFPRDDAAIVSKRTSSKVGYQLDTTVDRGPRTIGFKLTNSSGGNMFRYGATTLQANTWYHVTGVYNAATSAAARVSERPAGRRHAGRHGHRDAAELVCQRQHRPPPGFQQLQPQRSHRRRPHLQQSTDTRRDPGGHERADYNLATLMAATSLVRSRDPSRATASGASCSSLRRGALASVACGSFAARCFAPAIAPPVSAKDHGRQEQGQRRHHVRVAPPSPKAHGLACLAAAPVSASSTATSYALDLFRRG